MLLAAIEQELHTAIIPYIPLIATAVSVVGVGIFAIWNRRRGAVESKAPSVTDLWNEDRKKEAELDLERRLRRWFETAFYDLRRAFRGHLDGHTTPPALNPFEQSALDATPPNLDKENKS